MLKRVSFAALALCLAAGIGMAAQQQQNDPIMVQGNYEGSYQSDDGNSGPLRVKVVGDSNDEYHAIFISEVDGEEHEGVVKGKTNKGVTHFEGDTPIGDVGAYTISGDLSKGVFKGTYSGEYKGTFEVKRVVKTPPSLGKKAPEGAVVLFQDGNEDSLYSQWKIEPHWKVVSDGSFQIAGSSAITKQQFGSGEYHLEFKTKYMPNERGQARSNSGFYILGRYEIQVLDSFGQKPADNLCGGIYQLATPKADAVLPPGEWQTYDVTFHAPKFDENGNKVKNAVISIVHNGITIQENLELPRGTPGGVSNKEASEGEILLQDHGDQPNFRNVWFKPLAE